MTEQPLKILVACEYSGRVRDALIANGHDATSCDLEPTEAPGPHIQGDVLELLNEGWDMMIAHPPCTRLCNSGVRWLHERDLWDELDDACAFFRALLDAPIPKIAIENPVMHKYAVERIGRSHDFTLQPYEHGEPFTKRTCFWLSGLSPFEPTNVVSERQAAVHRASPGPDRWKERSRTYRGVAVAMANAWAPKLSQEVAA